MIGIGNYDQARAELVTLTRESPQDRDAQLELATVNVRQGKVAEAEAVFRKYYIPGQPDLRPLTGLMEAMNARHEYNQSIHLLTDDLAKSPNPTGVRALIAQTAVKAHQYPIAISQYEQSLNNDPQSVDLYVALGAAYPVEPRYPQGHREL